eukprot:CAMPEP_0180402370 /NCGR_PEP_ID=MMETSP0989-20121125/38812_1 /TAXON_ID=697907 /ORGANISM="non described non described, Strain CCMP2293" /LENGTH=115 /DNA_ID=CAMNT_0022405447 /DNA_START=338 /DNA_END=682 /DNA_ORIENTATION=-
MSSTYCPSTATNVSPGCTCPLRSAAPPGAKESITKSNASTPEGVEGGLLRSNTTPIPTSRRLSVFAGRQQSPNPSKNPSAFSFSFTSHPLRGDSEPILSPLSSQWPRSPDLDDRC